MKRTVRRRLSWFSGFLFCCVLAFPVANWVLREQVRLPTHYEEEKQPSFAKASAVFQQKCLTCHSSKTALPFYAGWPFVRDLIQEHLDEGRQAFHFFDDIYRSGKPPNEVTLAKLEYALTEQNMPPLEYQALHWEAILSSSDKQKVLAWVSAERAAHYASHQTHSSLHNEPIQPLPPAPEIDTRKVALGKELFHDTRLSGDGTISCASCHSLELAGTDRRRVSIGIRGQEGAVNAPTVFNASLHHRQFWDGRAKDLVEQARGPVTNPVEMGATWEGVVSALEKDDQVSLQFREVYGGAINSDRIVDAIAAFEETLLTPNSPFDQFLKTGDQAVVGASVIQGYELFKELGCSSCHAGPAVGGLSFEKLGLEKDYFSMRGGRLSGADFGRYNVTKLDRDRHRFKVPSLRNVELTAPYFHDGSVKTLEEAVRTMAKVQRDVELSREQTQLLVSFLKTLTGNYNGNRLALKILYQPALVSRSTVPEAARLNTTAGASTTANN